MRIATVLTPITPVNLQLAAQCGVTDLVSRYPGPEPGTLRKRKQQASEFGLMLSVVEGYLPIERLKLGCDEGDQELNAMRSLLRQMHDEEIPLLCYNFMAGTDWVRTRLDAPERGGARVTAFDVQEARRAISLNLADPLQSAGPLRSSNDNPRSKATEGATLASSGDSLSRPDLIGPEELWRNLQRFLEELVPLAESLGITLAMHPDDPPLSEFRGKARIMNRVENFERLVSMVPSKSNAICFCQGSFAEMEVDIPETIRRLGRHIQYVHFRDIRGTCDSFTETFHDNGQTDMAEAMHAYHKIGFTGPIRPDHVPQLVGEEQGEPGYTMLGRLFAFGYMRGLMHGVEAEARRRRASSFAGEQEACE